MFVFFVFISLPRQKKILYMIVTFETVCKTLLCYFIEFVLYYCYFFDYYAFGKFCADIGSFACKFFKYICREPIDVSKEKQLGYPPKEAASIAVHRTIHQF